ncbi:MAG TPA: hypothetical protein VGM03_07830, partial [Phycisphaerae bacterium]
MRTQRIAGWGFFAVLLFCGPLPAADEAPSSKPDATIDLATVEDVKLVKAQWRYSDVKIVEVEAPGPDGKPTKTHDIEPHAQTADFDDSKWPVIEPTTLGQTRAAAKLSFAW